MCTSLKQHLNSSFILIPITPISTEAPKDVTSNSIPGKSIGNPVHGVFVPGMCQSRKSDAAETPPSISIEHRLSDKSISSSDQCAAGVNADTIDNSNFTPVQLQDTSVQDTSVLGTSQTRKSNAVETPLSIPLEDRFSNKSVSSSDQVSTKLVNADRVGVESSLVNSFMKKVSSIISRQSHDSGVNARNTDSRSAGGSPDEMV
ncbi:unnamed protein product [Ambrosiozyma monospora]|uniref:Unnamed protein product n=1 Tax=Ambrosiozyma monospora TaxID=43982 RepID=A0ACB5UB39_AMBMO|nr:unnamed protein product [Ambrosiozyma monospora]